MTPKTEIEIALGVAWQLLRLREARGLDRHALAAACGIPPTRLYKLETGHTPLGGADIARLTAALDVAPSALFENLPDIALAPIAAPAAPETADLVRCFQAIRNRRARHRFAALVRAAARRSGATVDPAGPPDQHGA